MQTEAHDWLPRKQITRCMGRRQLGCGLGWRSQSQAQGTRLRKVPAQLKGYLVASRTGLGIECIRSQHGIGQCVPVPSTEFPGFTLL